MLRLRENIEQSIPFFLPEDDDASEYITYLSDRNNYPIGKVKDVSEVMQKRLLVIKRSGKDTDPITKQQPRNTNRIDPKSSISRKTDALNLGNHELKVDFKNKSLNDIIYIPVADSEFKKLGGISEIIERRLNKNVARFAPTQISPWIDNKEMKKRLTKHMDELVNIDPRFGSLFVDADYNQLNVGVFSKSEDIRKEYNLSLDLANDKQTVGGVTYDSLYFECVDVWSKLWLAGVKHNCIRTGEQPSDRSIVTSIRRNVMTGYLDEGVREIELIHKIIQECEEHPEGTFMNEKMKDIHTVGFRRQIPGGVYDKKTKIFNPKYRLTTLIRPETNESYIDFNVDLEEDGAKGQRVRLVVNISTRKNLPNMQANAILTENLSPKLERIFTQKPEVLEFHKGSRFYTGDVSKYDNTSTRKSRRRVMQNIFSQRLVDLWEDMEHDDILICYDQVDSSKSSVKDIKRQRIAIPRRSSKKAYDSIELLSSGHGLTSIFGKSENPPDDIRSFCLLLDVTPDELCQPGYIGNDDLLCWIIVNGGDDRGSFFKVLSMITGRSQDDLYDQFRILSESSPAFAVVEERPGKTTGRLYHENSQRELTHVTGDAVSLLSNQINPEFGIGHANRSDVVLGLSGAIESYFATAQSKPYLETLERVAEITLDVMGFEGSIDDIHDEADQLLANILDESGLDDDGKPLITEANAPIIAADIMGLANPSRLYYDFTRRELEEKLPPEVLEMIWLSIPARLGSDYFRFINKEAYDSLELTDNFNYPTLSKRYPNINQILSELASENTYY